MALVRGGQPDSDWGPWFTAGFDSDCAGCHGPIDEGDNIRYDPVGDVVCEECGLEGGDLLDAASGALRWLWTGRAED